MLKYLKKLVSDVLPSVVATCIGAYLVNHYIIAKPDTPPPPAAAQAVKAEPAKPAETPAAAATSPEPAKAAAAPDKAAEKPAERTPARHSVTQREKAADKAAADKAAADKAAVDRAQAEKTAVKPAPETAKADERRDPNDVLRAAVERLRAAEPARPAPADVVVRAAEPPRIQAEPPKVLEAPRAAAMPPLQPLAPPVSVAAPAANPSTPYQASPPYGGHLAAPGATGSVPLPGPAVTADVGGADQRLSPPADIPSATAGSHGDAGIEANRRPSVAEDVLFAAKSVFHAVLPR